MTGYHGGMDSIEGEPIKSPVAITARRPEPPWSPPATARRSWRDHAGAWFDRRFCRYTQGGVAWSFVLRWSGGRAGALSWNVRIDGLRPGWTPFAHMRVQRTTLGGLPCRRRVSLKVGRLLIAFHHGAHLPGAKA